MGEYDIKELGNLEKAINYTHIIYRVTDQRQFLSTGNTTRYRNINNIARWSYAVINNFPSFDEVLKIKSKKQRSDYYKPIAFICYDKRPAFTFPMEFALGRREKSTDFALCCKDELFNQIKLYSPDIIIWIGATNKKTYRKLLKEDTKDWVRLTSNLQYILSSNLTTDEGLPTLNLLLYKLPATTNEEIYKMLRSGYIELFNFALNIKKLKTDDNLKSILPRYFAQYENHYFNTLKKAAAFMEKDISGLGTLQQFNSEEQ